MRRLYCLRRTLDGEKIRDEHTEEPVGEEREREALTRFKPDIFEDLAGGDVESKTRVAEEDSRKLRTKPTGNTRVAQ
jgi:hypothetical protein